MAAERSVGVGELRQNLSVYLRRVEAGETLTVTDRRRPVAVLAPLPEEEEESPLERRLRELGATEAEGDLLDVVPFRLPPGVDIQAILEEDCADRI